jgi:diguanylate cyclase (GGDEF)-like protein
LMNSNEFEMGRLYVGDYVPRPLEAEQIIALDKLAQQTAWMIETHIGGGAIAPNQISAHEILWRTNQQLRLRTEALQEEHFYLSQLNNFMDELQNYTTLDEAMAQLPMLLQVTFPNQPGRLYISKQDLKSSKLKLPIDCADYTDVLTWGKDNISWQPNLPGDCPVVKTQHPCYSKPDDTDAPHACTLCTFSEMPMPQASFCVPLLTNNIPHESIVTGIFSISVSPSPRIAQLQRQMITQAAQHLGKVLTHLKQYELIHAQSIRDALTGLFNRRYLFEVLPKIFQRAHHGHYSVGIIIFDIDHFKQFNDSHGHLAGDKVLQDFGVFLKGFVRGTDIACRYGGEEFMLVLPEADMERIVQRANRLRQGMHYMQMEYQGKSLGNITISAGVASFPQHGTTLDHVIAAADAALYRAKADGRDRISVAMKRTTSD